MKPKSLVCSFIAAAAVCACQREAPEPPPQSHQQEAVEAEQKAASIEAAMNKDPKSEDIPASAASP